MNEEIIRQKYKELEKEFEEYIIKETGDVDAWMYGGSGHFYAEFSYFLVKKLLEIGDKI